MTKVNYFLPLLFFLFLVVANAQQEFIQGKLLDAETGEPVVFATIRIKEKAIGVISNQDGGFRIPIKFKEMGSSLEISSMGYQKKEIPMLGFSPIHINIVRLDPRVFDLEEAVVTGKRKRRLSTIRIVRKAIAAIPNNYPGKAFSIIGYYRDYQLDRKEKYINLNEAILEVFDAGFGQLDRATTKVRIYDYKRNTDFERNTHADAPYDYRSSKKVMDNAYLYNYGGNEFTILRVHDAVRNYNFGSYSFVERFDTDLLKNHSFFRQKSTYINGEPVYSIRFQSMLPKYSAYGHLYISHRDFAIHKMEYTLYDNQKQRIDGSLNRHQGKGRLLFEVVTEYRKKYNKMYLSYISFNNSFTVREPPIFKIDYLTVDLNRGCFVVEYNQIPNKDEAAKVSNYKLKYNGKRLKLEFAQHLKNRVFLFPVMDNAPKRAILDTIVKYSENEVALKQLLSIDVKPFPDINGNVLNAWGKKDYNQFREFFVQRVKTQALPPVHGVFMKKDRPIFEDQPVFKPDNFGDYWMNTPLQKTEQ